jgi:rSAM/selenodomain-associated transferase 1
VKRAKSSTQQSGIKPLHRVVDPNSQGDIAGRLCALAVMTKAPRAGEVKTRLVPPLAHDEAAQLNRAFLRDICTAISAACWRGLKNMAPLQTKERLAWGAGVYTPLGAEAEYENVLPEDFFLIPQRGDHFGDRLFFAAEDLFKIGFASVCLINSDSPTVSAESFAQAVELLGLPGDRIVLGPSDDGGYYLIGLKEPHREVFERIDWSTERVLDQTLQRASEIGVEAKLLPTGYDVDDPAALRRLCRELLSEHSFDGLAPNTRKVLGEMIEREGRARIWPE